MIKQLFNTIPIIDNTINAPGYLYSKTDEHQSKLKEAHNSYINRYKNFYDYLDSKNGTNLWNKRNTLEEYNPYVSPEMYDLNDSVDNVMEATFNDFNKNGGDDNEQLVPLYYNAYLNSNDIANKYSRLRNWTNIQAPSEFDNQANQLKTDVSQEITDSLNYINQLYNSNRASRMMNRANRYARRKGASEDMLGFDQIDSIKLQSHNTGSKQSVNTGTSVNPNWKTAINIGITHENPSRVTAHELAHTRNLFNTRGIDGIKSDDSPYYGNDYQYIKNRYKKWLTPVPDKNGEIANDHDLELSERYSDLMSTRMEMKNAGIVDGLNRRYTNRDVKNYMKTEAGKQDRFLQYADNIGHIRKALNRVWKDGGKLETNSNDIIYTPFIPDNEMLLYDNFGLPFYDLDHLINIPKMKSKSKTYIPVTNSPKLAVVIPNFSSDEESTTTSIESDHSSDQKSVEGNHIFKYQGMDLGHMNDLLQEAAKYGIFFRVTSGVRPGAKTKQGRTSYHALGQAIDITPIQGETYADLKHKIKSNPEFVKWMVDHGYGIYDETTSEVMKKTGANGAHWHIGKDKVAIRGLQQIVNS